MMNVSNLWLAIQSAKSTIKYLSDKQTRIEFTGNPPMLDRPVFLLNDEGERIGAAPEGEHLLESGKVVVIDSNGMLIDVKDGQSRKNTVELNKKLVSGFRDLLQFKSELFNQGLNKTLELSKDNNAHFEFSDEALSTGADLLVSLGEQVDDEWEEIDVRETEAHLLSEGILNSFINLSLSISGDSRKSSQHDTSLFKVRYRYAGNPSPQRGFCLTLMAANKVYRYEDLKAAENKVVNAGFGKGGSNTYSIWKYKGGVNCKHFWERVIYLKRNNQRVGVNEARRMILDLEPSEREAAKWKQNEKEVAQIAGPNNNYWRAN